jgi:hypothetical protein
MALKHCRKCGNEFDDAGDDWKKTCLDCWQDRKTGTERVRALESMVRYWEDLAKRGPEVKKLLNLEQQIEALDKENTQLRFELLLAQHSPRYDRFHAVEIPDDWQSQILRLIQLCHPDKHSGSAAANEVTQWLLKLRKTAK